VKRTTRPFHQFCSGDTIEWFEKHGVELKLRMTGACFLSNSSQTIIDCFLQATTKLGIKVLTGQSVQSIFKKENVWKIETQNENYY
jgi:predicted flavoprotein YhiN